MTGLISVDNFRYGIGRLTVGGDSMGVLTESVEIKWVRKKKAIMAKYPARPLLWKTVEEQATIRAKLMEHSGREITKFGSNTAVTVIFTFQKPNSSEGTVTMAAAVPGDELTKQFLAQGANVFDLIFQGCGNSPLITFT